MPGAFDTSAYASPSLRKAVHDKLHPGAQIEHEVMSIEDAFPIAIDVGETEAEMAVVCTIIYEDGTWVAAAKEIARRQQRKNGPWEDRPMTTDAWYSDSTKAMGRALTVAGIPMQIPALKLLMDYAFPEVVAARASGKRERTVDRTTGEISGEPRELTLEQQLAVKVADMTGLEKVALATWAKNEIGVTNLMKAGEHAAAIIQHIKGE